MGMVIEVATHSGHCVVCGGVIYVGDKIVQGWANSVPVAMHEECKDRTPIKDNAIRRVRQVG